jgi:hypothetical protein
MKYVAFIHIDDVKCFQMDVQMTHKLVVLSYINVEDHLLIKKCWVGKKMNVTNGKFKDEKNGVTIESSLHLSLEVVCVF